MWPFTFFRQELKQKEMLVRHKHLGDFIKFGRPSELFAKKLMRGTVDLFPLESS